MPIPEPGAESETGVLEYWSGGVLGLDIDHRWDWPKDTYLQRRLIRTGNYQDEEKW
jgi:hypothetical protein